MDGVFDVFDVFGREPAPFGPPGERGVPRTGGCGGLPISGTLATTSAHRSCTPAAGDDAAPSPSESPSRPSCRSRPVLITRRRRRTTRRTPSGCRVSRSDGPDSPANSAAVEATTTRPTGFPSAMTGPGTVRESASRSHARAAEPCRWPCGQGHDEDLYVVTSSAAITIGPTAGDGTVGWYAAAYGDLAGRSS
ncbi:MAG: hypothetical protein K0S37_4869 [Microbacterium sp.]|nr:hypothetical protein [Microbacterium sp.]